MENLLEKLSKEDLIKVIANISDTIQTVSEWKQNGVPEDDAIVINTIGNACKDYCAKNNWRLPLI